MPSLARAPALGSLAPGHNLQDAPYVRSPQRGTQPQAPNLNYPTATPNPACRPLPQPALGQVARAGRRAGGQQRAGAQARRRLRPQLGVLGGWRIELRGGRRGARALAGRRGLGLGARGRGALAAARGRGAGQHGSLRAGRVGEGGLHGGTVGRQRGAMRTRQHSPDSAAQRQAGPSQGARGGHAPVPARRPPP